MKPPKFSYHAPLLLDEVVQLLVRYQGNARLLAGGQSLVPMLNFRLLSPQALIDLRKLPGLSDITLAQDTLCIGAMTRQRALEDAPLVAQHLPLLRAALGWVGHLPTRSRGTIGGSLAHADPSAELPMSLLALDGEVVAHGPTGQRRIAAVDLFQSLFSTALQPDEVLCQIRIPVMRPGAGWAVEEYSRRRGDFAIVAVAVVLEGKSVQCSKARIAVAGVGGCALRLPSVEQYLQQHGLSEPALAQAAQLAAAAVQPLSDPVASADYRRHLTGSLLQRALQQAVQRMVQH